MSRLRTDPKNANRGTVRGLGMVERSLQQYGAGRSIVASADGVILAGNKTYDRAVELGIPVREIESDGSVLYVIRRTDLPYDDPRAKELAIADNRAGETGLEWDPAMLTALADEGVELGAFWFEEELERVLGHEPEDDEWAGAFGRLPDGEKVPFQHMSFILADEQVDVVRAALEAAKSLGEFVDSPNTNSNGNALARVCTLFLTEHGR